MENDYSLFFIRHGKLLLPYKDHSEMPFEVLADLASGKLNPPIDSRFAEDAISGVMKNVPLKEIKKIYTSPSRRCRDTAAFVENFIYRNFQRKVCTFILPELREVYFDLDKIYPSSERKRFDIPTVNEYVLTAMAGNSEYCEAASEAYARTGCVFRLLFREEGSLQKVLLVAHDFTMRVIEIYIKNKGRSNLEITCEDLKNTQRNTYFHGFATNQSLTRVRLF